MGSMKAGKGEEDVWKANEDLGPLKRWWRKGSPENPRETYVSESGKMKGVLGVLLVA